MPPISSYPTVEESVKEHETCDEYLTEGFLTEKEQQQLVQDEEAYREYLEEEATAEKERARAEKECEEEMKKEKAHNELFRLWGPSEEIWQATILHTLRALGTVVSWLTP
nr:hypothetical protein [Tanacetum cinerariifolium]